MPFRSKWVFCVGLSCLFNILEVVQDNQTAHGQPVSVYSSWLVTGISKFKINHCTILCFLVFKLRVDCIRPAVLNVNCLKPKQVKYFNKLKAKNAEINALQCNPTHHKYLALPLTNYNCSWRKHDFGYLQSTI